uniref:RIIa domain-containing protein n=1 Tax=Dicentrarchus labrax TaxID=13489 RepID=A0A8C4HTD5_DICLA
MSANNSTPYGVKSLLECISRATLLAEPDDIPQFLSTHVDEMTRVRDTELRDTKEVAFRYQEQWGKSEGYFI